MFVRLKIFAISPTWGWHRPGTTAPQSDAGRRCCLFHLLGAQRPLPALHKDHNLGLTSTLRAFHFHSIPRSVLPLQTPGDASIPTQTVHRDLAVATVCTGLAPSDGLAPWAWHKQGKSNNIPWLPSGSWHLGWERMWQPWRCDTGAGGKDTAAPLQRAGQATGHGLLGLLGTRTGRSSRVPATTLALLPRGDTTPAATPCPQMPPHANVPRPSYSISFPPQQPRVPRATVSSQCHWQCHASAARPAITTGRAVTLQQNLPAQPCYKSGSGGSAVRQSLPVRAPAPNVLLPHS